MIENGISGRNAFSVYLENLLLRSNIKYATVASALNYDVSYISKWITGRVLPSKKNLEKVLEVISGLVAEQPNTMIREELFLHYNVHDEQLLRENIARALRAAYYEATGAIVENQYINNAVLNTSPREGHPLLVDRATALQTDGEEHIAIMADLFSLDRTSKLHMAGIESRRFRIHRIMDNFHIDYVVDLNGLTNGSVYDVILLIHMMTNFSLADFRLYHSEFAKGKLMIAAQRKFAGVSLLSKDHQFLCTVSTQDKTSVESLYGSIRSLMDPDKLIFISADMERMLLDREYFHNLISRNNCWVLGHITEHLLPPQLFHRLVDTYFASDPVVHQEVERAYMLISGIVDKAKIILYHLALVDFMISGELDFFNRKVILSGRERQEVLLHIRQMFQKSAGTSIKLIKEGFSDDFKYISNPCFFLSDASSYLRLENKLYSRNLLLIKDDTMKQIFMDFFDGIWDGDQSVVMGDHDQIMTKLDDLLETADYMM